MLDALTEGLTSTDPTVAAQARFFASGIPESVSDWLRAETRRETPAAVVTVAVVGQLAFILGGVMALSAKPDIDEAAYVRDVVAAFGRLLAHEFASARSEVADDADDAA